MTTSSSHDAFIAPTSNHPQSAPQQIVLPSAEFQLPTSDRGILACKSCHRILADSQFVRDGCRDCGGERLRKAELTESTTRNFSGYFGIVDSKNSWIARLIGKQGARPGVYAGVVFSTDGRGDGAQAGRDPAGGEFTYDGEGDFEDEYDEDDDEEEEINEEEENGGGDERTEGKQKGGARVETASKGAKQTAAGGGAKKSTGPVYTDDEQFLLTTQ